MAHQATLSDLLDNTDKSAKERLHEELQSHIANILKACTRHKAYALPKPELLDEDQGTEDANVMKSVEIADEIIAVATEKIEALKWDLVGELLNPGTVVSQAFKKACYLRYEHLSNSDAPSLLGLAHLIEQKENLKKKGSRMKGTNDIELNLPVLAKKRKSLVTHVRDASPSPVLADESLLKKVNDMTTEEMTNELRKRGLRSSGVKADLISRLKAARCDAYRPEEAAWADGLTNEQMFKLAKQSTIDMPKAESREKLKVYLYENANLKDKLKDELEAPKQIKKELKPNVGNAKGKKHQAAPERQKIVTTTEEPRWQRRLIILNFPSHTTERDIQALMARYGGLLPIQQGPGEFIIDCSTAADAKQAIADMRFQLVEGKLTRCVLEAHYIQEKKKAEADKKAASATKHKNRPEAEPETEKSAKKVKIE